MFKPHLACDADESKLKFPLILMPKIDGVRGLNVEGNLVGRSLKSHGNVFTSRYYSRAELSGIDGELITAPITSPEVCRVTTGDINRRKGEPNVMLWAFDLVREDVAHLPYIQRLDLLTKLVLDVSDPRIGLVQWQVVSSLEEVHALEESYLEQGFEGIILRDPDGVHKHGRSTAKSNGYLRIKRFVEEDATVLRIVEGNINNNEAKTNELGRTERSSHQENMTPNGMVGSLVCLCHVKRIEITVSAGCLDHEQRKHYFENPDQIIGQVIKYRSFPKGVKDKPRFPTLHSFRAPTDLSK